MSDINQLLADLVEHSRREMRVDYREYLELRHGLEEDRRMSPACLSRADLLLPRDGMILYRFHDDETRLREEDQVVLIDLSTEEEVKKTEIVHLDLKAREIGFKKMAAPPAAIAVLSNSGRDNPYLKAAIETIGKDLNGHALARAILERQPAAAKPGRDPLPRLAALKEGFLVVQGPPGTGKTYTGAHAIVERLARGERIGIMAQSHKAMNELVERVAKLAEEKGVTLNGLKAASRERDKVKAPGVSNVTGTILVKSVMTANLVAGTIYQMARLPKEALDVIFFDEAGQLSLAYAIGASRAAKAAVFLGDHRQLPHVSKAKHPGEAGASLMGYLLGELAVVPDELGIFLDQSYRMNREITELISVLSYAGRLKSHPDAAERRLDLNQDFNDPLGPASVVFLSVEHAGNEQSSVEEAEAIAGLVKRLQKEKPEMECLVVAAYRAQENLIRSLVGPGVDVGTVDKFQGKEADVVFYSLAASDPSAIPRDAGFLLSTHRLNVALSRARRKAILVCSPLLLEVQPTSLETMRLANGLCKVRAYHAGLTAGGD